LWEYQYKVKTGSFWLADHPNVALYTSAENSARRLHPYFSWLSEIAQQLMETLFG